MNQYNELEFLTKGFEIILKAMKRVVGNEGDLEDIALEYRTEIASGKMTFRLGELFGDINRNRILGAFEDQEIRDLFYMGFTYDRYHDAIVYHQQGHV